MPRTFATAAAVLCLFLAVLFGGTKASALIRSDEALSLSSRTDEKTAYVLEEEHVKAEVHKVTKGPFGENLGQNGPRANSCPFRFSTRRYDQETGLYCFGKRYYDPVSKVWLSRDPAREAGGINLYAYCGDDPVANIDPYGLEPEVIGATFGPSGEPLVVYQDFAGSGFGYYWNSIVGGKTRIWTENPTDDQLARLFKSTSTGLRLADYDERFDTFQQQFGASIPQAAANAQGSFGAVAKLSGGGIAAASGVGLIADGLTVGGGVVLAHDAWFTGANWSGAVNGQDYPITPEGALLQSDGASPQIVAFTDLGVSNLVPFGAGFGGPLSSLNLGNNRGSITIPLSLLPYRQRQYFGNQFNTLNRPFYPYNEVYIGTKAPYPRLDSYIPGVAIISRKDTQLARVTEATGIGYVRKLVSDYSSGSIIANVPSSGPLAGETLEGAYILEVPPQAVRPPQSVLDEARRLGVTIRDTNGNVYW